MPRILTGLALRLVFWAGALLVLGDAVLSLWRGGHEVWAVVVAFFFPVTLVLWPWTHEAWGLPLWAVAIVTFLSYVGAAQLRG